MRRSELILAAALAVGTLAGCEGRPRFLVGDVTRVPAVAELPSPEPTFVNGHGPLFVPSPEVPYEGYRPGVDDPDASLPPGYVVQPDEPPVGGCGDCLDIPGARPAPTTVPPTTLPAGGGPMPMPPRPRP